MAAVSAALVEEIAVADALVDPRQVLIDDAAGAHVHVADLGVAHLPRWEADGFARRDELRVRIAAQQLVVDGLTRQRDGVVRALGANPPAVEDDEDDGVPVAWARHASCLIADASGVPARCVPSASSMRSSWLYLATRSVRLAEPVLIWPALVPTARSAMVVSSVSPERCEMTLRVAGVARHGHRVERLGDRADLVQLHEDRVRDPLLDAARENLRVGHEDVVADELDRGRRAPRSASSSRPSRLRPGRPRSRRSDTARTQSSYSATISSALRGASPSTS